VWLEGELIGTVLGFDACHHPNHYNILISTPQPCTGPEVGMHPERSVRFVQAPRVAERGPVVSAAGVAG
jgi:hypothetical protein